MDAVVFDPATDTFSLSTLRQPKPGPNEVRVKVIACGLNPVDAKIRFWKGMVANITSSHIGGLDVSGIIDAIGADVTDWKIGDQVLYHGDMLETSGGFTEYALARAEILINHPNVDAITAAATPCAGWTAWRVLHDKLRIQAEDTLVITGATGGVGSYALQIARLAGVKQVIAVCSKRNFELAKSLGATACIDYRTENIVKRVNELTEGTGVTKALDCVGAGLDIDLANVLAFEGEPAELVTLTRPAEYRDSFLRALSFHQFSLGSALRSGSAGLKKHLQAGISFSRRLEGGDIQLPQVKAISLADVPEAMNNILKGHTVGKIVVSMN